MNLTSRLLGTFQPKNNKQGFVQKADASHTSILVRPTYNRRWVTLIHEYHHWYDKTSRK